MICCPWTGWSYSLLDLVAGDRAADGSQDHRHVASGAGADQAADAKAGQAADDCADSLVVGRCAVRRS
jgi:hypothetical protein